MQRPRFFRSALGEAHHVRETAYGRVGMLHSDQNFEVVWVSKQGEPIDPDWFSASVVDVIVVLRGKLRVEFQSPDDEPTVMNAGDALVLPPGCACRAYRWPRDAADATIFLAVYKRDAGAPSGHA
jgi:quercetin dioxygenase-like cupin family protein